MANSLLTAEAVTREALRILHQKLNFIGSINRQYDDSFSQAGAKTGDSLKIRLPNQYSVRTGKTLDTQDTTEQSVTLQVATQKGVDVNFSSLDLTLSMDDFAKRVLDPAMSVLAANIEADAISMYKDVYNEVADIGSAIDLIDVLNARKKLQDNLAPTANRSCNLNTQDNVDLVDELKGLFHDSEESPASIWKAISAAPRASTSWRTRYGRAMPPARMTAPATISPTSRAPKPTDRPGRCISTPAPTR